MGNISRLYKSGIYPNQPNDATQVALELDNIIENGVNDNDTRITTNSTNIASNSTRITAEEATSTDHEGRLTILESGTAGYLEVTSSSYTVSAGDPNQIYLNYTAGDGTITLDDATTFTDGEWFHIHMNDDNLYGWKIKITGDPGNQFQDNWIRPGETLTAVVVDVGGTNEWICRRVFGGRREYLYVDASVESSSDRYPEKTPFIEIKSDNTTSSSETVTLNLPQLAYCEIGTYWSVTVNLARPSIGGTNTINVKTSVSDGEDTVLTKVRANATAPTADTYHTYSFWVAKQDNVTFVAHQINGTVG